ncbi:hypothetical protein G7A72_03835 [Flavobacterium sp. Sr18]|uniref:hypothetical protein n=1 Tax=Flavobacterium sp. Sr18 TaxID=935222 RepID=UPI0013E49303|nr:hypothetical protein [Flavobacterium sp. Sr18]QIH37979.1 hypothetical protein G7A72_03835 [Flavobacterium sp. Sr18]
MLKKRLFILSILMYVSFSFGKEKPTIITKQIKNDTIVIKIEQPKIVENSKVPEKYMGYNLEEWKTFSVVFIPLFVLFITNLVTLGKIRKETKESIRKELILTLIKNKKEQLEKYYDPIIAYLSINESIFNSFGPKSFPDDDIKKEVSANLWLGMRESIIVENNSKISEIIKSFSHLISSNDDLNIYLNFIKHTTSYEHFIKNPSERHSEFPYPSNILETTTKRREEIINEIHSIESNVKTILDDLKN